jgi:ABC-type bacteriocin/lantibiotic exporter with double-glycine peptidase domain
MIVVKNYSFNRSMENRNITQSIDEPILKLLDFPELRQTYNFDCGVTCLQQVFCYYGIEVRESIILDDLKPYESNIAETGIKLSSVKVIAGKYGLGAEIRVGMNPGDLISLIDKRTPVIVLLQAWRDENSPENWAEDYLDGHFVVAIGCTKNKIIFEDPSSFNRTFLDFNELSERWHDIADDNKSHVIGAGVIITGTPNFRSNEIKHMN